MNEREKMLKKVMEYEFSVIDAGLYLDSYPDNECAVDYFLKTRAITKRSRTCKCKYDFFLESAVRQKCLQQI